jgi:hypothetical protein
VIALQFNEWSTAKAILISWGYTIFENELAN